MKALTLEEAKQLYASTGFCGHSYTDTCKPPNCGVKIKNCIVCAEEIEKTYY